MVDDGVLARRVQLVGSATGYPLGREIRTVLDVGCGQGVWRAVLRHARPRVRYTGVDSSAYTVRRYARSRHLPLGSLGTLDRLGLDPPYELVACSDALHCFAGRMLKREPTTFERGGGGAGG